MARFHKPAVVALLLLAGGLALGSLMGDSVTYDETSHVTSGFSYLRTGDFRLAPDHPPLAKVWAALPVAALDPRWECEPYDDWHVGEVWGVGVNWLFQLNDGQRLIVAARCAIVLLLLATLLCIYALGRSMFGPASGLLALALAALCPTMLAHGHYVTTDMPATLLIVATLLASWRAIERTTVVRSTLACAAFAALTLTKFSWPLVLPALVAMAIAAVLRPTRPDFRVWKVTLFAAAAGVVAWLGIWTMYGWSYTPFRGADATTATMLTTGDSAPTQTMEDVWRSVGVDYRGQPVGGLTMGFVRLAREYQLLPEAYLYGLAFTAKTTIARGSYFMGEHLTEGTPWYFPLAFAIKTPLATQLLLLAGATLLVSRRVVPHAPLLLIGLLTFAAVYGVASIASGLNIGHRHLLPLYPLVFVIAGSVAAALWKNDFPADQLQPAKSARRTHTTMGRVVVCIACAWLAIANLWTFPHYLGYFNESIGGSARGSRYLADSNLDWGQDLKRLADYARQRPDESIKLAYFGTADPTFYVPKAQRLSGAPFSGPPARFDSGTYIFSVTQLLGVYFAPAQPQLWTEEPIRAAYARQFGAFASLPPDAGPFSRNPAAMQFVDLRAGRLMSRLHDRSPDIRIGTSLVGWRLSKEEVDRLIAP